MTDSAPRFAPGWPGIPPRWTSSAKTGIGTALNQHSKVWFTLSHGILNEVYFPRVDQACTRDMGFIVTNGRDFFSEEKRNCTFEIRPVESGIPAYDLTNTCMSGVTESIRKFSPILTATSFCRRCGLKPCRASSPTIACSRSCLRIWPIVETATPVGSATTKVSPCSSLNTVAPLSPWPRRRHGKRRP